MVKQTKLVDGIIFSAVNFFLPRPFSKNILLILLVLNMLQIPDIAQSIHNMHAYLLLLINIGSEIIIFRDILKNDITTCGRYAESCNFCHYVSRFLTDLETTNTK